MIYIGRMVLPFLINMVKRVSLRLLANLRSGAFLLFVTRCVSRALMPMII